MSAREAVQAGPGRCGAHEDMVVRMNSVEQEQEYMGKRIDVLEAKVYSPQTMVAIIGLVGTLVTVAGSLISVVLMAILKSHGVL